MAELLGQDESVSIPMVKVEKKPRPSNLRKYQTRWAWFFISPWLIGLLLFTLIPVVATLVFSFTNYSPVTPELTQFIGLQNYVRMTTDPQVAQSLLVTVKYAVLSIPISLAFGLFLAYLVNTKSLGGKAFFRTMYYMPMMIPVVASALIWAGVMNTQTGWINLLLQAIGVQNPPDWLNSTFWIYPALVMIGLWGLGNLMLTLLAGMQGVPNEMYEAADLDGAGAWIKFRHITIPLISPVLFYNLTLMVIGAFKYFDMAYVLKNGTGGPDGATLFYNLNLYKNAFVYNLMGYGSALAWVLFIIVFALAVILFGTSSRWVYYAGEGRK